MHNIPVTRGLVSSPSGSATAKLEVLLLAGRVPPQHGSDAMSPNHEKFLPEIAKSQSLASPPIPVSTWGRIIKGNLRYGLNPIQMVRLLCDPVKIPHGIIKQPLLDANLTAGLPRPMAA